MRTNLPLAVPASLLPLERQGETYVASNGVTFPVREGVPVFVSDALESHMEEERTGIVNALKTFLRKFPRLYIFLIYTISPICFVGMSPKRFLKRFSDDALVLNVGSGIHRYTTSLINLDIFYYKGVDIVGDAMAMPLLSGSIDGAICECLLEHVPEPQKVVDEMLRVLKPGGSMYIAVPFVYPFHASPNDFYRWTIEGLKTLCKGGTIENVGPRSGPASALTAQLVTMSAIIFSFGNNALYEILSNLFLLVFWPIKFIDVIIGRFPTALHGAGSWYIVVRKNP